MKVSEALFLSFYSKNGRFGWRYKKRYKKIKTNTGYLVKARPDHPVRYSCGIC